MCSSPDDGLVFQPLEQLLNANPDQFVRMQSLFVNLVRYCAEHGVFPEGQLLDFEEGISLCLFQCESLCL